MSETHFNGKVAQKAIVLKEGKVLLMRDPRETKEIWELPGGRLNEDELPPLGLARELKEELGVEFAVHEVVYIEQFFQHSDQKNALMIAYFCTMVNDKVEFQLQESEVCEIGWFTPEEAMELDLFPEYRRSLEVYFA